MFGRGLENSHVKQWKTFEALQGCHAFTHVQVHLYKFLEPNRTQLYFAQETGTDVTKIARFRWSAVVSVGVATHCQLRLYKKLVFT